MVNKSLSAALFGAIFLGSLAARAESPSMTLKALHSMEQAQSERAGLCARLSANPNCRGAQALLKQTTGLTTSTCEVGFRTQKCAAFLERFPQYKPHAMSCEPQTICKLGLEATMAEGCHRFGIEVKDSFLNLISAGAECATQWQCLARTSFSGAMAVLMPGPFAARKAQEIASSTLQSFRDDRAKLEKAACLDPETQAQLYCYLGVNYGSMVLGAGGAARAAGAGLMARMATLEKDLIAADVSSTVRAAAAPTVRVMNAETQALRDYIRMSDDVYLEFENGQTVLTLNYFHFEDARLLALMNRAVRSGGISKIDAGGVVGPKVLNVLTRMRDLVPPGTSMRIEGTLTPKTVDKEAFRQIASSRAGQARDLPGFRWSDQDVANYQQARRILGIDEACDRLFVGACGSMRFSLDARHPEATAWTRAR